MTEHDLITVSPRQRGFTLVELLIVVSIIAILVGAVGPNFYHMLVKNRLSSAVFDFRADLNYARSESIRRGEHVIVCKSSNGSQCDSSASWSNGWIIYNETDSVTPPYQISGTETLLRSHGSLGSVTLVNVTANSYLKFLANGQAEGKSDFWFCNPLNANQHKAVTTWATGRTRTYEGNGGGSC